MSALLAFVAGIVLSSIGTAGAIWYFWRWLHRPANTKLLLDSFLAGVEEKAVTGLIVFDAQKQPRLVSWASLRVAFAAYFSPP